MVGFSKWRLLACSCLIFFANKVSSSQDVMKKLTTGFVKTLMECKNELNLPDHIIQDLYNFWREDYQLLNRDVGCAIMCMAAKHNLVTDDMNVHHENAHEFATKHGADDETAKTLVSMIHECEKANAGVPDDCDRTLEISKCFRTKIHELKWAPDMQVIVEELLTEV